VKETEVLGENAPPKQASINILLNEYRNLTIFTYTQIPRTLENTREIDETFVRPDDEEVYGDEKDDEFAVYFSNEKVHHIMQFVLLNYL